jgi:hypothetical protein
MSYQSRLTEIAQKTNGARTLADVGAKPTTPRIGEIAIAVTTISAQLVS